LVVDPGNPDHIVVRATFGIVETFDAGATWLWVCESAVGYGGVDDPAVSITEAGTLLVGIRSGVATSFDDGCGWAVDGSALAGLRIVDLATDVMAPSTAIGISADDTDGIPRVVVAETIDDGMSWTVLGPDLDSDIVPETIDASPSMPARLYVSAIAGAETDPVIERSSDRGQTWTRIAIDIPGAERTFISAISPTDPDTLYLRVPGELMDRLYVSRDAAETWTMIAELEGEMLGFAAEPNGERVAVGIKQGGVHVARVSDHVFTRVADTGVRCLTWSTSGLYACGNEGQDGFTVARSADGGVSFTPLYHLLEIGMLACAAGTEAGDTCPALFPDLLDQLGNTQGVGGAGGAPSASSSSGGSPVEAPGDHGCGCHAVSSGPTTAFVALGAAVVIAILRRQRPSKPPGD